MVFFFGISRFLNPLRPDTQDIIAMACALRIEVKMIIDGHVAIAKETCRVIGRGIQILTTEVIPAIENDTLGYRFGEHVESSDDSVGVHPEHNFQIVQVRGGSTGGLDWKARPRASPGGSTGEFDWCGSFGVFTLHELD